MRRLPYELAAVPGGSLESRLHFSGESSEIAVCTHLSTGSDGPQISPAFVAMQYVMSTNGPRGVCMGMSRT